MKDADIKLYFTFDTVRVEGAKAQDYIKHKETGVVLGEFRGILPRCDYKDPNNGCTKHLTEVRKSRP